MPDAALKKLVREALTTYAGNDFSLGMCRIAPVELLPTTADTVSDWLRGSVTLHLACTGSNRGQAENRHEVVILPSGEVKSAQHTWADLNTELAMSALSGRVTNCFQVWHLIELGHMVGQKGLFQWDEMAADMTMFAFARMWALNRPTLTAADRKILVEGQIMPDDLATYELAGVPLKKAKAFLRAKVPYVQARPWIEAKLTDHNSASAAKEGRVPHVAADSWKAAGFNGSTSRPWKKTPFTPLECASLKAAGVDPWIAGEANERSGFSASELLALLEAGVPADRLWDFDGWDFEKTIAWAPIGLGKFSIENIERSVPGVRPADAIRWHRAGAPHPRAIVDALQGHATQDVKDRYAHLLAAETQ